VVNTLSSIDQLIGRPSYKVSSFKVSMITLFRGAFFFIHSTRMFPSRELKKKAPRNNVIMETLKEETLYDGRPIN